MSVVNIVFAWRCPKGPDADESTVEHLQSFHGWSDAQIQNVNTDVHMDEHHGNPSRGLETRTDLAVPHTHDRYQAVMLAIAYAEFHPGLKAALFQMIDACSELHSESVYSTEDWQPHHERSWGGAWRRNGPWCLT